MQKKKKKSLQLLCYKLSSFTTVSPQYTHLTTEVEILMPKLCKITCSFYSEVRFFFTYHLEDILS